MARDILSEYGNDSPSESDAPRNLRRRDLGQAACVLPTEGPVEHR